MARPKKAKELTKVYRVTVRFPETQYEVLSGYANIAGLPLADYIRKTLSNSEFVYNHIVEISSAELQEIAKGLWKIGNNLNQISRYYNQNGTSTPEIENEVLSCIREIYKIGIDLDCIKKR